MDWIGARHDQAAAGPSELLLSDEAATELLASRYPVMTPRVRRRLLDTALGNPLAQLELPVSLGDLAHTVAGTLPAALPPGRRLQTAFASRVQAPPASVYDLPRRPPRRTRRYASQVRVLRRARSHGSFVVPAGAAAALVSTGTAGCGSP